MEYLHLASGLQKHASPPTGEEGGGQGQASIVHAAELVIDGGTLSHILGTPAEQALARVGAQVHHPLFIKPQDMTLPPVFVLHYVNETQFGMKTFITHSANLSAIPDAVRISGNLQKLASSEGSCGAHDDGV